ncbi:hypothetical protein [Spirosoma pollinicola]|nr:hypothetical protein [Spirosoma pollinicola]
MKTLTVLLLSMVFMISSCKKDEIATEGEKIAQQVQTVLTANSRIKTATFYISNVLVDQNQTFTLTGQYITTANGTYNLSRLIRYQPFSQSISFYF